MSSSYSDYHTEYFRAVKQVYGLRQAVDLNELFQCTYYSTCGQAGVNLNSQDLSIPKISRLDSSMMFKVLKGNPPLFSGGEFKGSVQHSVKDLCRCFELKRFARPGI